MRHVLIFALVALAMVLAACSTDVPADTYTDVPLAMADYPQATPAPTQAETCWAPCTLTYTDVRDAAIAYGHSAPCFEDELMVSVWTGDAHGAPICVPLDDAVNPSG